MLRVPDAELELLAVNGTYRAYSMAPGEQNLVLEAEGYHRKALTITVSEGMLLEEKLERLDSRLSLLGEFPAGVQPKSAAFSPDGENLVVPLLADGGIGLYDTDPFRYRGIIPVPERYSSSLGFVESLFIPGADELWVTQMTTGLIHVIDTDTWEWKRAYRTGGIWPKVMTLSPEGELCAVSNWISKTVSFLDVRSGVLEGSVPVGGIPRGMVFHEDGTRLYVCLFDTGDIDIIDCRNLQVVRTLRLGPGAARHIQADFQAGKLFVTDMYNGTVAAVSISTGEVLAKRYVGANPNTLELSPDRSLLFVSVRGKNNSDTYLREGPEYGKIVVLDSETLEIKDWTWGRNQPTGLAVSPDGGRVVFTNFLDASIEVYALVPEKTQ